MHILNFVVMYFVGFLGMIAHWIIGYNRGVLDSHMFQYFLTTNKLATVKALLMLLVSLLTMEQTGMLTMDTMHGLSTIFLAGYAIDNSLNSEKE